MISLKTIFYFLLLILILHIAGSVYHWYWLYPWFDIPMHFLGGFWLGMVYLWLNVQIETSGSFLSKFPKWFANLIFILAFAALVGVFWEFYEYAFDFLAGGTSLFQGNSADTMGDMFFDLAGAGTAFAVFYTRCQSTNSCESTNEK